MTRSVIATVAAGTALLALALSGCGGAGTAEVSGTVTMDGQPVPNALVTFTPEGEGSPAYGRTDSQGQYKLQYTQDASGAVPGQYVVSISTYTDGDPDAEPPVPRSPETVPARYNVETELTATVDTSGKPHDFALESSGDVRQPDDPDVR